VVGDTGNVNFALLLDFVDIECVI